MPTLNQKCKGISEVKFHKPSRARFLARKRAPMGRGIVRKMRTMKPKKPNSAQRKIARVKLTTGRFINCYIPGLGHKLRDYAAVFFVGGGPKDLNGIQYRLRRGQLDFSWEERENIERYNKLTRRGVPKIEKRLEF